MTPLAFAQKHLRSARVPLDPELARYRPELEEEVVECVRALRKNAQMFNLETEPELIDQRIFERQALLCRYRFLISRAKALGLRTILRYGDPPTA